MTRQVSLHNFIMPGCSLALKAQLEIIIESAFTVNEFCLSRNMLYGLVIITQILL